MLHSHYHTYHLSSLSNTSDLEFLLSALAWRASWYLFNTKSNCLLVPLRKNCALLDAIVADCIRLHTGYCQPRRGRVRGPLPPARPARPSRAPVPALVPASSLVPGPGPDISR